MRELTAAGSLWGSVSLTDLRVLVTGGTGKLGRALTACLPEAWFPTRAELNICARDRTMEAVADFRPDVVMHTAAMTDVRAAEANRRTCYETNVSGTRNIVDAILAAGKPCRLIFLSTACVFSGQSGDYAEDDTPAPANYYGAAKLMGERIAMKVPDSLVVRTNFVERGPWPYPRAFADRFGSYLYTDDVALQLYKLIRAPMRGVVHVAGDKKYSMFEIARLSTPEIGKVWMAEMGSLPLTRDMTLVSQRWPVVGLGTARQDAAPAIQHSSPAARLPQWPLSAEPR